MSHMETTAAAERASHALADDLDELTPSTIDKPRGLAPRASHITRASVDSLASASAKTPAQAGS